MRKFLLVLVLGATLVACGTNDSDSETKGTPSARPTSHPAHDALAVTDSNNDQERTLRIGQQLVVSLPANPSTGYTWGLGELERNVLRQDGEPDYLPASNVPVAPGSGGTAVWTFVGNSVGVAHLTLDYTRPWEQGIDPAQKFSLTIKVE
ncbi:protease inhibitor I42 family protein [Nocardia sp. NPDC057440]|uniref:protease inhibitor I42 family protein n=1 Tax=Nocardia sp. NPDC057440 TaxID=3346134 RepID=UPI00366D2138